MGLRAELSALGVRFERSAVGECLLSVLVCVVVLVAVVWNLPDSHIRRGLVRALQPVAESTGLQQKWSMYAPDPVSVQETLQVRVAMSDGSHRTWTSDRGTPLITSWRWYHWQKLKEQLIRDDDAVPGFARWVVGELTSPGERPVHVEVLVRREALRAPGDHRAGEVTQQRLFSSGLREPP